MIVCNEETIRIHPYSDNRPISKSCARAPWPLTEQSKKHWTRVLSYQLRKKERRTEEQVRTWIDVSNLSEERRLARVLRDGRTSFLVDDVDQSMVMSSQQRQKWAWVVVFYGSNHLVNDLGHGTKILHVPLKCSFKRTDRNKKYNTNNESRKDSNSNNNSSSYDYSNNQ